ncbi:MAG: hypothetical protein UU13_C0024G0004 [Candidatus Nomurabacteria bacterium GW2011_GWB1_40_7]|uniref:Sulfatase N-terminal domain-containing protein n=1 Tax=Candidatus Nomurabacteria bacterium GW2011_GWB1_40_7 TaxID=1618744 RepID=A0A0G0T4Q9_9BACT|nr:MAG: hypothetical protein UU13_C0024G0004 [Candidatus Nomurabacteria bacterium GW2011_GWB1_40_7]
MKNNPLLHPLLIAAFPILFLYSHNMGEVSLKDAIAPLIAAVTITSIVWLCAKLIIKNNEKAGLISFFFIISSFFYGHAYDQLKNYTHNTHQYLLILWVAAFFAFSVIVVAGFKKWKIQNLTYLLNITSIILVCISISIISYNEIARKHITFKQEIQKGNQNTTYKPDIYYIILDGYGRADMLNSLYGYDNGDFLTALEKSGFYVASRSRSNYSQTTLSLASSLNFHYLDDLAREIGKDRASRRYVLELINKNNASKFLEQEDYTYIAFSSVYGRMTTEGADITISPQFKLSNFDHLVINATPIPSILEVFSLKSQYDLHREQLMHVFQELPKIATKKEPTFTFAHIIAPHPPFVFNADGNPIQPANRLFSFWDASGFWEIGGTRDEYRTNYINQLVLINKKLQATVENIISLSPNPPIIVLQADHGPGSQVYFENPDKTNFKERMSIFNAYYLPSGGSEKLYREITPANTFRLIFNYYFGTNYELLEDKSYYSTYSRPYDFMDVTNNVSD